MIKISVPRSHPRYLSLYYRDILVDGVRRGITSLAGLTAHGRGEAFDYLIGEKTHPFSLHAIEAASALLAISKHPVISVNGNTAILAGKELVKLGNLIGNNLEVNIFHASKEREKKIRTYLMNYGAVKVLMPDKGRIPGIESNRRMISSVGQAKADVIFVPLEDGDRTESLIKMGKKVITCDLNPLSRTARAATVTIVDHIIRAMPLLIEKVRMFQKYPKTGLIRIVEEFDNKKNLSDALLHINRNLSAMAGNGKIR